MALLKASSEFRISGCFFAAAHALRFALLQGRPLEASLPGIGICALLFIAMGLLFVGGFGVSAGHVSGTPWVQRFKPHHLVPAFNEAVFFIFVVLSFLNQAFVAPSNIERGAASGLQNAIYFVVPGQRALVSSLEACTMDGGRVFAAAFASCLPRTIGWPLPAGMGGVTGDAMLRLPLLLVGGHLGATSRIIFSAIFGALALAGFVMVAGFFLRPKGDLAEENHREAEEFEEEEERASISRVKGAPTSSSVASGWCMPRYSDAPITT